MAFQTRALDTNGNQEQESEFTWVCVSPKHARSVALVLNPRTGLVSPQHHVKFGDMFHTVKNTADDSRGQWKPKAGITKMVEPKHRQVSPHLLPRESVQEEARNKHKASWAYRTVIGKLLFLEKSTRGELAYSVHQAARFCEDPKESHTEVELTDRAHNNHIVKKKLGPLDTASACLGCHSLHSSTCSHG